MSHHHYHQIFLQLLHDERGQDLVEYALAAVLIGLAATTAMSGIATTIATGLGNIGTRLTTSA